MLKIRGLFLVKDAVLITYKKGEAMATAKKLPSGSWRVRVYSHTNFDGKKIYESFTAPTKKEAELMAAEWNNNKNRRKQTGLTVKEAIEGYIKAKEGVLSPSTIRAYKIMLRNSYDDIAKKSLKKITTEDLQLYVSNLAKDKTPKYVSNAYGLLSSSIRFYEPNAYYRVTLPKKVKKQTESPSDNDIQELFNAATPEMKKCICLAAFGSLRRGEICALLYSDIKDGVVSVTKDMVQSDNGSWVVKDMPKTSESCRSVALPDKVIDLIGSGEPDEPIIKYKNPTSVTRTFIKLRDRKGLKIRFHDLRHFYASIGVTLGCSDIFLAETGGWAHGSNSVMKKVYQNSMADKNKEYSDKMKKHFDGLI